MAVLVSKDSGNLKQAIRAILDHFEPILPPSRGFFLKPNIVFPVAPDTGEITRPAVVRAVVEGLREKYGRADIVIGEGTAAGTVPHENFDVSGFKDLARELGVDLLDLNEVERVTLKWKYGEIGIPAIALDRTHINLPILKLSAAAIVSGAIKNIKGLISPTMKKAFHRLGLHEPLAELASVVRPELTILDCSNFSNGRNLFISGTDALDIDVLAVRLLQIEEPEYLALARQKGLGGAGEEVGREHLIEFSAKKYTASPYKHMMNLRLWSNPRACSLCRETLRSMKRWPTGDLSRSLRAYIKLAMYALTGADLVFGSKPHFERRGKTLICIGDCTKGVAEKEGCSHIPGCPPTREDVIRHL